MNRILLLGQHGTGKGTLGRELARIHGFVFLSAGDLLRAEIRRDSAAGRLIAQRIADGADAPEDVAYGLLADALDSAASFDQPVILDGFPRYASQMTRLHEALRGSPEHAMVLDAPTPILVHRLRTRVVCTECHEIYGDDVQPAWPGKCHLCGGNVAARPEDNDVDVIARRHRVWLREGSAIVEGLHGSCVVTRVDATRTPREVVNTARATLLADRSPR